MAGSTNKAIFLLYCIHVLHLAVCIHGQNGKACHNFHANTTLLCHANSTCITENDNATCICNTGFVGNGTFCTTKNECFDSSSCALNATCKNASSGFFSCECQDGFVRIGENCLQEDACARNGTRCHKNASCQNSTGIYSCKCMAGYIGNGTFCKDMDECANNGTACGRNASCINTSGSHSCKYQAGFTGDGMNCININECLANNTCDEHAACKDSQGSYSCSCKTGFAGNGTVCNDINECKNQSICFSNDICQNTVGSYKCSCATGFARNVSGLCVDIDECQTGINGCSKSSDCINNVGSYQCVCKIGFSGNGTYCQEIDLCETNNSPCHQNATCFKSNGKYQCTCKPGYNGNGTICGNINECFQGNNCSQHADCFDTIGSYSCRCKKGYRGDGRGCTDINECKSEKSAPCKPSEACINTFGSYSCRNYCKKSVCPRFSSCRNLNNGHVCRCSDGLYRAKKRCRKAKRIFFVHGLVLKRKYLPRYADEGSNAFNLLAVDLEASLLSVYRRTQIANGLASVKVIALRQGSVLVSYYLLYANRSALTVDRISSVATNLSLFASLNPDLTRIPRTRVTTLCETGGHGCSRRATCKVANNDAGFICKCKPKFELRDGKCKKKRTYAEIIIPSVIGGLLVIFFACLLAALLCKRRHAKRAEHRDKERYQVHIENLNCEQDHKNVTMQMDNLPTKSA